MELSKDPLIAEGEISEAVFRLARQIDDAYQGKSPVFVGVLKSVFVFLADLVREVDIPIGSVEFIRMRSYGESTTTSGAPSTVLGMDASAVEGRHVIIVEDIVDTGLTANAVKRYVRQFQPASVAVCALLDKPSRRRVSASPTYVGFIIPDEFVVGYGLDFNDQYRNLSAIHTLKDSEPSTVDSS